MGKWLEREIEEKTRWWGNEEEEKKTKRIKTKMGGGGRWRCVCLVRGRNERKN